MYPTKGILSGCTHERYEVKTGMANELNQPDVYEIKIRGQLQAKWAGWLNGEVKFQWTKSDSPNTTILLPVTDQAALRGVLNRIWDLNLSILSVNMIEGENTRGGNHEC